MPVDVVKDGKVFKLLLNNEAQRSKHSNTAMRDLGLSPSPQLSNRLPAGGSPGKKCSRVENVGKRLRNAG
jgi:hypothetical protein